MTIDDSASGDSASDDSAPITTVTDDELSHCEPPQWFSNPLTPIGIGLLGWIATIIWALLTRHSQVVLTGISGIGCAGFGAFIWLWQKKAARHKSPTAQIGVR